MRILNVISGKDLGGSKQSFLDTTAMLLAEGFDVVTLTRPGARIYAYLEKLPTLLPQKRWVARWYRSQLSVVSSFSKRQLSRLLVGAGIDVVLLHKQDDLPLFRQVLPNATLICIGHGFATRQMQYADAVFPVSQAVCAYLQKHGVTCPMVVVPNAVACPADLPQQASKAVRRVFTFGTMAVFRRKKRLDVLLTAAQILKDRDVDCRVLIAGRGHRRLYLQWLVWRLGLRGCASLLPWVRDKAAFFSDLDVFCVTSRTETFGIALIEAMRYGIPVLSSDCGGPSEILSGHGVGGIVPVGDATALADALQAVIKDSLGLEQQRKRAFLHVRQYYATDAVAPVLARAIRDTVSPSDTVCVMGRKKCIREKYTSV